MCGGKEEYIHGFGKVMWMKETTWKTGGGV